AAPCAAVVRLVPDAPPPSHRLPARSAQPSPNLRFRPDPALPFRPALFRLFPQPHPDRPIGSLPASENETAKAHPRIVFRFRPPVGPAMSSPPRSTPTSRLLLNLSSSLESLEHCPSERFCPG
ncbi:hypothetical protein RSAG8_04981, partial [Rhizoctonia solani AG-8 WAC10335]